MCARLRSNGVPSNNAELVIAARSGSTDALGKLFETCRAYLILVANEELDSDLRAKIRAQRCRTRDVHLGAARLRTLPR